MNTLIDVLKDHHLGTWCKGAAWIILLLGLVQDASNFYVQSQLLAGLYAQSIASAQSGAYRMQLFTASLANLPSILFYFFALYALGTLVQHVSGSHEASNEAGEAPKDGEDEDLAPRHRARGA